jgi:hypothetical protein
VEHCGTEKSETHHDLIVLHRTRVSMPDIENAQEVNPLDFQKKPKQKNKNKPPVLFKNIKTLPLMFKLTKRNEISTIIYGEKMLNFRTLPNKIGYKFQ